MYCISRRCNLLVLTFQEHTLHSPWRVVLEAKQTPSAFCSYHLTRVAQRLPVGMPTQISRGLDLCQHVSYPYGSSLWHDPVRIAYA